MLGVLALGLALIIKAFLVQAFYIPSGSMEQTLQIQDRVLVNKLVYRFREIHRGEIVVFNGVDSFDREVTVPPPANKFDALRRKVVGLLGLGTPGERDFIKRVIGVPGDVVACCSNGRITVNGQEVVEPYLHFSSPDIPQSSFGPVTVTPGKLFVMGDHRDGSSDSRSQGLVPANRVVGRAFVVIWPPTHAKPLQVPDTWRARPATLPAAPWSVVLTPPGLGLAGAVPAALLLRRRRWHGKD